jgi:hypothetical protein
MYIGYFYIPTYNLTIRISYISPFVFMLRETQFQNWHLRFRRNINSNFSARAVRVDLWPDFIILEKCYSKFLSRHPDSANGFVSRPQDSEIQIWVQQKKIWTAVKNVTFNDSNLNKHTRLYTHRVEQNNIDDLSGMTEGTELRILR